MSTSKQRKKTPKKMVRRPSQARSVATVEAILEAAARILDRDGAGPRFTVGRIAREAGVGVGSVYEYFASKDAIVRALAERHMEGVRTLLDAAIAAYGDLRLEEAIGRFVDRLFTLHFERPRLQETLHLDLPQHHGLAPFIETDRLVEERVTAWLASRQPQRSKGNLAARVFVAVRAVRAVTVHTVAERVGEPRRTEVREQLKSLLAHLLG